MTAAPGPGVPAGDAAMTRASDADRERVVDELSAAFAEGRLSKEEHDARVEQAYGSLTQAELAALAADLPAGQQGTSSHSVAVPRADPLATASLVCGLIPLLPATIAAIILGVAAHRRIRRTGERGAALATAGLALALFWLGLTALVIFVF